MNLEEYKELTAEIFDSNDFESLQDSEFIEILEIADDFYNNDDDSYITDAQYDLLRRYAEALMPAHKYFTGVGSDLRGGKIKLPFPMGSLDQIYEGDIEKWISKNGLGIDYVVITDKLDGTSGMVVYDSSGEFQIAYSRGNGTEGADISRHFRKMQTVPDNVNEACVVRGEVIIEISTFRYIKDKARSGNKSPYKNPRNMVAGIMNSKTTNPMVYDYIKFVAYEILGWQGSKTEMLQKLEQLGFEVPYYYEAQGAKITDNNLANHLELRKQDSIYEIDGLVLDVNDNGKRFRMDDQKTGLNPKSAVKYKVMDASNLAIVKVLSVTWQISRHGYLKPVINIEPVELGGVTISNCTGFNANYIYTNKIQPGCEIRLTRAGDVIPFCLGVVTAGEMV